MAITPTSYDPQFWSDVVYRSLDLYSGEPVDDARAVAQLLVEYFRHSTEKPTHFSYQVMGTKQRKLKTKTIDKILETIGPVEGRLESMYIESIRDEDHTHAVVSAGYSYDTIVRENCIISVQSFRSDFDISIAQHLAKAVADSVQLDYGFSSFQTGIVNATGFGLALRIESDRYSAKRERWLKDFQWQQTRPTEVPFLDVFELNVLSDMHLSKSVGGKPFDAYVREKGRGTLERIGKANHLWCLEQKDIARAKAELSGCGLVAMV